MIRIRWQDQPLDVDRLVLRRDDDSFFAPKLLALADQLALDVADDHAEPRPGDFWIGCQPEAGWGAADPERIGWASVLIAPLAVGLLRNALPWSRSLPAGAEPVVVG